MTPGPHPLSREALADAYTAAEGHETDHQAQLTTDPPGMLIPPHTFGGGGPKVTIDYQGDEPTPEQRAHIEGIADSIRAGHQLNRKGRRQKPVYQDAAGWTKPTIAARKAKRKRNQRSR